MEQDTYFASKTGHLDWYSKNLDLYEISKIKFHNFFLLATYAIRSATFQFLSVINSNYEAISHGNSVSQQMTLIWIFKVSKSESIYATWFATHDLLLVHYSNYSAISAREPCFSADNLDLTLRDHQRSKWL